MAITIERRENSINNGDEKMNNKDKIIAIFLKTEASDEYLYCLSGGKEQILEVIKNSLGDELEYVSEISVEAHIPNGIAPDSEEAVTYRQFESDVEEIISDEVDKMLEYYD